jgi:hypothetical protein
MRKEFESAGAVCSIEESFGPQTMQVQKVMSQRSTGLCTRCTRANEFPVQEGLFDAVILFEMKVTVFEVKKSHSIQASNTYIDLHTKRVVWRR